MSERKYKNYVNLWCFNNKNVFTAIRVVCINGGSGQKNLKMVSLRFFNPLISKHIKIYLGRSIK